MANRKSYDKYNMFSSSVYKDDEEKQEKSSVAARIFERRGQALKQDGSSVEDYGMSPSEAFRRRKELLKTATQRTPEQTDILREDRQQAAKEYARIRREKFQSDLYGDMGPNTYMDSASSEELSTLGKIENNREGLQNIADEYAKVKAARAGNTVITKNLDTASSASISELTEQAKKAGIQARQRQNEKRAENQYGFRISTYGELVPYEDIEKMPDYNMMVNQAKEKGNEVEDYYNGIQNAKPWNKSIIDKYGIEELTRGVESNVNGLYLNKMRAYSLLSDTERYRYDYIYEKAGKEAANNYLESIQNSISRRGAEARYEAIEKQPLSTLQNIIMSAGSGAESAIEGMKNVPAALVGATPDYKPKEYEHYQDILFDESSGIKNIAYKTSSIIGNLMPAIAAGTVLSGLGAASKAGGTAGKLANWASKGTAGSGVLAAQTGGQTYRQDIMEGRPVKGAQINAALTAADEAATNYLLGGISKFGGGAIKKILGNTKVAQAAKLGISNALSKSPGAKRAILEVTEYGADMLSEGTQEAVQDITESLRKHFIYGDELDLMGDITDPQTWEDFALGAITAGVMNAPGTIAQNIEINQYGKDLDVDYRDYVNGLDVSPENYINEADHQEAADLMRLAEEYAARQANKEYISNRDKAEYDMRFRQLQQNITDNNTQESVDITHQNEQHSEEQYMDEQSKPEPIKSEYEPNVRLEQPQKKNNQKVENTFEYQQQKISENELDAWAEVYGKEGQQAFKQAYDNETDLQSYYRAFAQAYNAGRYNMKPQGAGRAEAAIILSSEQFEAAFKAGAHDRNTEIGYDPTTYEMRGMVQGKPKEGGLGNVTQNATAAQQKVAKHIGKLTGLQIDLVDEMPGGAVAAYEKGRITISVDTKDFNGSAAHELTHYIKDYAPDMYQIYQDRCVKAMMESQSVDLEDMIASYTANYETVGQKLSRAEAMDEIVADATQKFLNDPDFVAQVVHDDVGLAQKIVDFFSDVIDAIKELMKTGSSRKAAKALEENLEHFEACRKVWLAGLDEGGDRYKSGWENQTGESTQYQLNQFGFEEFTEKEKGWWKDSNIVFCNSRQDIIDFCNENLHKKPYTRLYMGKIGNELAERIYNDTGIELEGYNVTLTSEFEDSHGDSEKEKARGQIPVTPEIIADLPVIISQYDEIEVAGQTPGGKPALKFVKDISGKRVAVEYVRTKRKQLELQTLYAWKEKSNRNVTTTITMPDKPTRTATSETYSGMVPIESSIIQPQEKINKKFQLEDVDESIMKKRLESIIYENQMLKEANALLEKQFQLTPKSAVRQEDVQKVARKLLKDYNSAYKTETLSKNLDRLYEYIRSAEQVDSAAVTEAATSIAKSVIKQSQQVDTELTQMYKDLRNQVKNTKIKITDQDKADLASAGGYNEFRRRNFGRMKLGNDGISVDSLYQELSAQHPELFPDSVTHPADQLMTIASALEQTDAQVENPYHANLDEMSYIVGQEILQSYFDVRNERPTFADKKAAEVQRVKREYTKKMNDYKDKLRQDFKAKEKAVYREHMQKIDELTRAYNNLSEAKQREMKDYYKQEMDKLRNQKNQSLVAMQNKSREQIQKIRDSHRAREAKKSIIKETKAMLSKLQNPTDSKHVPEILRTSVAQFLNNINFSSNSDNTDGIPTLRTQEWQAAQNALHKIIEKDGIYNEGEGFLEIDPDLAVRIEDLVNKTKGIDKLDNLDAHSLEELNKVVLAMKKAINEANALKSNKKSGELSIIADGIFNDLRNRKNRREFAQAIGMGDKLINYDMLDPQTMFGLMGDNTKSLYNSLRDGLDRKTVKLKLAQDHVEKIMRENNITLKQIRDWTGAEARVKRFQTTDGSIDLTVAQVMSLYELQKRNQAKGHMFDEKGGIKPVPRKEKLRLEDGKIKVPEIIKTIRPIRVKEIDVMNIINSLTPEQKAFANGMQYFMGTECAEWGNEVTMSMYGYKKFTAGNYFPIVTDGNYNRSSQGKFEKRSSTIKNMGMTKSTVKDAHNPIMIEDIFDVYSRQIDNMSTYNAYVLPLSDLNKVFNYIDARGIADGGSIKQEIERVFGKAGNKYIDKLVEDINGSVYTEKGVIDKVLSNMKSASVAGNIRVAIQQPTAYVRASMEISPKYLARGAMTMTRKGQWELISKYAPIAQWKDWGFYRMDTSRQMKDIMFDTDSRKQRFVNKTMVLAEAGDKLAWNRLWRACEFECMDNHPELNEGTDAFYQEVGKRFSEIVDKTQVVDSVLHRTQIMRDQNLGVKMATSFMAEPLKTYDMLYRAVMDVRMGNDKSKRRAARAAAVFVLTNVATALAAATVDAGRDDDRKKGYKEKYREEAWKNFQDSMNIINYIPYAKDVVSVFSGYSQTRADTAAYQDLYYAFKKLNKVYSGDSNLTPQYVALYTAEMSSKLLGLPIRSISRDTQAITDTIMHEFSGESSDYKWLKQKYAIGSKENLNLYVGMMIEAHRSNDIELQQKIKDDLNAAKIDNDTISSKIKTLIKGELISKDHIDPRIDEAARAKMEMDLDTYESAVQELMEEGYAGKLIGSAIESRLTQLSTGEEIDWEAEAATEPDELYGEILTEETEDGEDEWNIYSYADVINAIELFDDTPKSLETFNRVTKAIVDNKVQAGKKESEAISPIKSAITHRYKTEWIKAYKSKNKDVYEAIQKKLKQLKVNGKALYGKTDWESWLKEAKK